MERKRILKAVGGIFAILLFLCISCHRTELYAQDKTIVKVGFYPIDNYIEYDNNGELTGYEIEYFNRIAEIKNIQFEYIDVKDIDNGYQMLNEDKIDLLAPVTCDRISSEYCAYGEFTILTSCGAIAVSEDNTCVYEDFDKINKMKIGVVKDVMATTEFQIYMQNNSIQSEIVEYDTIGEVKSALKSKKIDAMAVNILDCNEGYNIVEKYSSIPIYIAAKASMNSENEKRTDYLKIVSSAISKISVEYGRYEDKLIEKYLPVINNEYLTKKEIDIAANMKRMTVGYIDNQEPLSYQDESGHFKGISRDVLDLVQKQSGLKFKYVRLDMDKLNYDYLKSKGIDIIAGIDKQSMNYNESEMNITNSYFTCKKLLVGKNGTVYNESKKMSMAVAAGTEMINSINDTQFSDIKKKRFSNIDRALDAVINGKADFVVQNEYVIDRILTKPKYDELKILPVSCDDCEMCMAVVRTPGDESSDKNEQSEDVIVEMLNKAISQIDDTSVDLIVTRESINSKYALSLNDVIYKYRYAAIAVVFAVIALVVFTIETILLKRDYIKKLKTLSEIDGLTEVYNKRAFVEKGEAYFTNCNRGFGFIFVDLDNFKKINDSFGHAFGDMALKDAVAVIKNEYCSEEIIGRFGGDEFCIVTALDNESSMHAKMENVRKSVQRVYKDSNSEVEITASIGGVIVQRENKSKFNFNQILIEADKLLYCVKESGKNKVKIQILA